MSRYPSRDDALSHSLVLGGSLGVKVVSGDVRTRDL